MSGGFLQRQSLTATFENRNRSTTTHIFFNKGGCLEPVINFSAVFSAG
jgi:hypothetical protein